MAATTFKLMPYGTPGPRRKSFAVKIQEVVAIGFRITRTLTLDLELMNVLLPLLAYGVAYAGT